MSGAPTPDEAAEVRWRARRADYEILSGGGSLIDGSLSREDERALLNWIDRLIGEGAK